MRRIALLVTASVLFAWGAAAAIGGCGGATAADVTGDPPDGSNPNPSNGSSSSSGSNGSGGAGGDAGAVDASNLDGSHPGDAGHDASSSGSNAGKITCGASECNAASQVCCRTRSDAGCIAENGSCLLGVKLSCDEAADCGKGEYCCLGVGSATCQKRCLQVQRLCKTDQECGDGGKCTEKTVGGVSGHTCGRDFN